MRMWRAPSSASVAAKSWPVEHLALSLITAATGPQPCSRIQAAPRVSVTETLAAFSTLCSSA
jgi:hypothetical protein